MISKWNWCWFNLNKEGVCLWWWLWLLLLCFFCWLVGWFLFLVDLVGVLILDWLWLFFCVVFMKFVFWIKVKFKVLIIMSFVVVWRVVLVRLVLFWLLKRVVRLNWEMCFLSWIRWSLKRCWMSSKWWLIWLRSWFSKFVLFWMFWFKCGKSIFWGFLLSRNELFKMKFFLLSKSFVRLSNFFVIVNGLWLRVMLWIFNWKVIVLLLKRFRIFLILLSKSWRFLGIKYESECKLNLMFKLLYLL